jgi:hypothetical protein
MPATGMQKPGNPTKEKNRRIQKGILELTLEQLHKLYNENHVPPLADSSGWE